MPSHTDTDPNQKTIAPDWMEEWHVKGNKEADLSAAAAADLHCVPEEEANSVVKVRKDL